MLTILEKAGAHLKVRSKRVIISAPFAVAAHTPKFLMDVNHEKNDNSLKIVSNASYTTNCLAILVKAICDNFRIVEELMATVHAMTATQKTVGDPSGKLCHDSHGAAQNTIAASAGAAKAVSKIIPELNRKLTGVTLCVATLNVSVMDLICCLEKAAISRQLYNDIKKEVKQTLEGHLKALQC